MKLFSILLLLSTLLFSNERIVKEINFEGMVHISESVALRMLDFKVGDTVDDKTLNEAFKKYYKQGYFKDLLILEDNGVLTFKFVEKPVISKIEMKGYKEDDEEVQASLLQIKKGMLYDEKKLEAAKTRIINALSQEGKIDSVVEIETTLLENGSMKVTFLVNEGETIIIQKLDYYGVEGLKPSEFNTVIANKEHQWAGWFFGRNDGKMALEQLSYDPLRIRDLYMQFGYLDAKIDEPFVRVDFDHYSAQMSYQVDEGEVYFIENIKLFQQKKVISDEILYDVLNLKVNEAFNIQTFRDDSERIKTKIADLGYAFVQVLPDLQKDEVNHTVNVIYKIIPGNKVFIRNVIIEGNNRTLDRIIRRELFLAPGDLYNLTDLRDSRNAIGRSGYFETNTVEEKRITDSLMDLVVKVKEAPTGNIQLGGGYGSYGGLLLSASITDRNIWGSGINMGVNIEHSELTQSYSFNISNPHLNDSDFSGNFSIYKSRYAYNDYSVASDGITVGTGHRFTRYITGYMSYGYSATKYEDIDLATIQPDNRIFFESYNKSAVTLSANFDNTDDYYLPRIGFSATQSFERAGLGGEADFLKSRTSFNKYYGIEDLIGFDAIFRYKARYSFLADTGYIPLAERFYMGGLGSVRGYESYSLSPREENINGELIRIGGKQTFSNSAEVSFPLVPKAKMRLTTFVDWGFIGQHDLTEISKGGYGAAIEWFSPVGPIQLIYALPLNFEDGDRESNFEFTMGQRF